MVADTAIRVQQYNTAAAGSRSRIRKYTAVNSRTNNKTTSWLKKKIIGLMMNPRPMRASLSLPHQHCTRLRQGDKARTPPCYSRWPRHRTASICIQEEVSRPAIVTRGSSLQHHSSLRVLTPLQRHHSPQKQASSAPAYPVAVPTCLQQCWCPVHPWCEEGWRERAVRRDWLAV